MPRSLKLSLAVSVVALVAAFWAAAGVAANHDTRLDAVASQIAGHPVVAVCPDSEHEWVQIEDLGGNTVEVDGFTQVAVGPNIYLSSRVCSTLEALLFAGPSAVGPYWSALAIKTLIHESVHQTGQLDEGITDCTALSLVQQYAVADFGYTTTVAKTVIAHKLVKGKRVYFLKTIQVPNPELIQLYSWAVKWHRALPANYQGGC